MISVIVQKGFGAYLAAMVSAVFRLIALIALVLMPLGMGAAPALAAPGHHQMMTAGPGHCDEQQDQDKAPASKMDCASMCTALPAANAPSPAPALKPVTPRTIALAWPFTGIEPEIATPPPKYG